MIHYIVNRKQINYDLNCLHHSNVDIPNFKFDSQN